MISGAFLLVGFPAEVGQDEGEGEEEEEEGAEETPRQPNDVETLL